MKEGRLMSQATRAQILADHGPRPGESKSVAHIYDDGYVLMLSPEDFERAEPTLRDALGAMEVGRSGDGTVVAAVLPCEVKVPLDYPAEGDGAEIGAVVYVADDYQEHRGTERRLIEHEVELARHRATGRGVGNAAPLP
jgi:hypothetical protein